MKNEIQVLNFDAERIALIKATVAKDATDLELQFFVEQCKRTQLDPVQKQIYFIKDKNGKVHIQVSIDGLRLIAERSDKYQGQTPAMWCGTDGVWKDVWLSKTPPAACKVGVLKAGFKEPLYAVALFEEYTAKNFIWNNKPSLMLAKVAEALALRKAFPNDMSGIYTQDEYTPEVAEAEEEAETVVKAEIKAPVLVLAKAQAEPQKAEYEAFNQRASETSQEQPQTVEDLGEFVMPIGKEHKGKKLKEIPISKLEGFTTWLQQKNAEKPLAGEVLTTLNILESYISQLKYLPEA